MFRLKYLCVTCVLALTVGAANANTFTTFDASGTFDSPSSGINLYGSITVDVTVGSITGLSLNVTGFDPFNILFSNGSNPLIAKSSAAVLNEQDYLYLTFSQSLIGYTGGQIASGHTVKVLEPCTGCDFHTLFSGSFTAQVSTTPLPAALPLFATGLGAMGLLGWRRKRENTAALAAA